MPANRSFGMDHDYYRWSPLPARPTWRWPGGEQLALCVLVDLERYELDPPLNSYSSPETPGGRGGTPFPDVVGFSSREYGMRVGIFRVMRLLDKYNLRATVAVDDAVTSEYPSLLDEFQRRDWEIVARGRSGRQLVTSAMSADQEREYIQSSLDRIERASGDRPVGWRGPEYSESHRTPELLAEAGVKYVLDWPNDEQPYEMRFPKGSLVSLPVMVELDDVYAHWYRKVQIWNWEKMVIEAFGVLESERSEHARLFTLSLHPWLIGQPYRIRSLDTVLKSISLQENVYYGTGKEVMAAFLDTASERAGHS